MIFGEQLIWSLWMMWHFPTKWGATKKIPRISNAFSGSFDIWQSGRGTSSIKQMGQQRWPRMLTFKAIASSRSTQLAHLSFYSLQPLVLFGVCMVMKNFTTGLHIYDAVVSTLQALLDELLYILNRGFHLSSHGFRLHFGHLRPRGFESIPSSMFFTLLNLCKVRDPSRSARCCRLPSVCCLFWFWSCPRTKKMSLLGKNTWKITRYGNTLILSGASP